MYIFKKVFSSLIPRFEKVHLKIIYYKIETLLENTFKEDAPKFKRFPALHISILLLKQIDLFILIIFKLFLDNLAEITKIRKNSWRFGTLSPSQSAVPIFFWIRNRNHKNHISIYSFVWEKKIFKDSQRHNT